MVYDCSSWCCQNLSSSVHNLCIIRQTAADTAVEGLELASIHADSELEQTIEAQVLQIIM